MKHEAHRVVGPANAVRFSASAVSHMYDKVMSNLEEVKARTRRSRDRGGV